MLQYERLKTKYKMDWVISLDGNNEPLITNTDSSVREYLINDWNNYPIFRFPLKYIIPLTSRSAFINSMKQALFQSKMNKRLESARKNDFPARKKWLLYDKGQLNYNNESPVVRQSVDSFFYYMKQFDERLTRDNVPHLLFIQPHLTMRTMERSSPVEKALLHYYMFYSNRGEFNSFIAKIHEISINQSVQGNIRSLSFMHYNNFETFVDYCHFTETAIKQLSVFFADCISSSYYHGDNFP